MNGHDFEFDVAFSFHRLDESLATQLNDLVQDRFKTFLYSKKQEVLSGADGEEIFSSVFGKKARCVVIFYRKEWGQTPFTRIEETAIRNRAFDVGYDFTLFIPTEKSPNVPPWLPKTRLWFGLDRFGLTGAAAVIEARVQDLGGESRVESITDRAARLQRARELDDAKKRFRESEVGVHEATKAFDCLISALKAKAAEISAVYEHFASLKVTQYANYWLVYGLGPSMSVCWRRQFANSLDGSFLNVKIFDGVPRLPGLLVFDEPLMLKSLKFGYALLRTDWHAYVEFTENQKSFLAEDLADHLLSLYMDTVETHKPR